MSYSKSEVVLVTQHTLILTSILEFLYSPQPVTVRGQAVRLSTDPKNEKLVYTNGRTVIVRDLDVRQHLFVL